MISKSTNFKYIVLILLFLLVLTSCSLNPITRSNLALDTVVTVTLYNGGDESTLDDTFNIINHYDQLFDSFSSQSEVNKITTNKTQIDKDLMTLLDSNLKYNKLTNGAFSPTLGRLIDLWQINEPTVKEAPTEEEIKNALIDSEADNLVLDQESFQAYVKSDNTKINLGASSKGFIADKIKSFLTEKGVKSAIINLGGNVLTIGQNGFEPFVIGIDNPDTSSQAPIATVKVKDKSVVTSGNYQRYFTDSSGKRYHHILDPKTGYPVENGLDEVVVISDSSLEGDILSTAFFVMGKDKSIDFLKNYENKDNIDVIFIDSDKNVWLEKDSDLNFELEPSFSETYQIKYY